MDDSTSHLQRKLKKTEQRLQELQQMQEEAERAREDIERQLRTTTLPDLLDRCHSLSKLIKVKEDATSITKGNMTDPVHQIFPKKITHWTEFPGLQSKIWERIERVSGFTSKPQFPSPAQLDFVEKKIRSTLTTIHSATILQMFEKDAVDDFVAWIIDAVRGDEILHQSMLWNPKRHTD
ncbi:hypothetical protein BJY04DRAFT_218591 [Aspergillus karnatakaensis]|uniref:uncharacterized protein n=1 Tax=Aspergillus karnatakaensis TaxID=1810916 RepID=UPI003CCE49E1